MLAEVQPLMEQFEHIHAEIFKWSDGLTDEQINTKPPIKDTNSIGNLMSHILGAEVFWVANRIGGQPVNRDRAAEFSDRVTREGLVQRRTEVEKQVRETLNQLSAIDLNRLITTQNGETAVRRFLMGLLSHLSGHMGQVIMTRKFIDAQP